ncbi:CDP-glycerol glycerophosphotransferase family protein [Streptomyces sp. NBC_01439]|uniref:CDP-glycerol glycerophosphotransferase family protein n=2 Tax=unclassified Streptomyces TaxID=2593676 RepID=UPI002E329B2B|nr:CDP-glycerol glycerophosphotransferase family protein [Streptomyces sp. NBC_01439]
MLVSPNSFSTPILKRAFQFPGEMVAPGPLVYSSPELIGAIRNIDCIQHGYAARYRWFQQEFCDLDDGYASARLADRILIAGGDLDPGQAQAPAVGAVRGRAAGPAGPRAAAGQTGQAGQAGHWNGGTLGQVPRQPARRMDSEHV